MDNRRTTKKARRRTSQDKGRDKAEKNKSRPQRSGGFSLNLYLPGVSRWSGVISHDYRDTSWYHIPYHSISQDTIYRDIVTISRIFRTDIEISYPVEIFLDIERIFCPVRCTKFSALSYGRDIRKGTQGLLMLARRTASLLYRRLLIVLNLSCEREWGEGWWVSLWGDDSRR